MKYCRHDIILIVLLLLQTAFAEGQTLLEGTRLSSIDVGAGHSSLVRMVSQQSYELEGGEVQSLEYWYGTNRPDLSAKFISQINDHFAFHWGFSIGERGTKYHIEPSVTIGADQIFMLNKNWAVWIQIESKLGGWLKESPCQATYTLADGPQKVNCRLAATPLAPEQTLQYLWHDRPVDQFSLKVKFVWSF